jgi:hypothetical protein
MAESFSPPEQVRKNAARSLELRRKFHRGMTNVGVARARDLSNGKHISADTIKRMHSYFARHEVDKKGKDWANQSSPSAGYIAWLGWGGDAGRSWVNGIMSKLNAKESQDFDFSIAEKTESTKAATVRGIFLRPGISKNRRLYTKENIASAIQRMQNHLASNEGLPLTMATSHGAAYKDDALSTVGRITQVRQLPDGSGMFEAEIANTTQGRDIAALAVGKFIKGVSIRGEWLGDMRTVSLNDGEEATTCNDLVIHGVDFTHSPGVEGAEIQYAALAESHAPNVIFESVESVEVIDRSEEIIRDAVEEAIAMIMEKDSDKPYGDVSYADPGYQADKKKRYPIDTVKHVRAAWSYINQGDNAKAYTPAQLRRVKARIKSAAKKFGINIAEEYETLANDFAEILEAYASMTLANDDAQITVSGNATDPHNLQLVANRIAFGAIAALHGVDPDNDGDVHLVKPDWSTMDQSPEEESYDGIVSMRECHECGASTMENAAYCHECGAMMPAEADDNNMECESCGATGVPEGASHCHMCGEELPQSVTKNAIGCTTCGEMTPKDAMYCPTCGDPVPQAESNVSASNETKEEVTVSDNQTAAEASAEESVETPARNLTDADLKALAAIIMAAGKATENAPEEEAQVEVAPEAEVEADAEAEVEVAAEVEAAAEESNISKENEVSENLFTAEQVAEMVTKAATEAAKAAVEAAKADAVESYRSGNATRKGLVNESTGFDASELLESDELNPHALAEMNSREFRKVQSETWGSTPFFAAKFAQADRGF